MEKQLIVKMQGQFDALAQEIPGEDIEFWFARDLQEPLGYARWENFLTAIKRAISSCETTGYAPDDHFRGVTKMITNRRKPFDLGRRPRAWDADAVILADPDPACILQVGTATVDTVVKNGKVVVEAGRISREAVRKRDTSSISSENLQ